MYFTDIIFILETKGRFALTYSYSSSDFDDVVVKGFSYVVEVGEDEGFAEIEAYCDDIFCVFAGEFLDVVDCEILFEEEFFIVG